MNASSGKMSSHDAEVPGMAETAESKLKKFHRPTPRQAALIVLLLLKSRERETGKPITRARLSESTLRKLWVRTHISNEMLLKIQEYLLQAGWALFWAKS